MDRPLAAAARPHAASEFAALRERVLAHYRAHGRNDLPWRLTRDPYAILVSEVMLQQTQVARVLPKYEAWIEEFETVDALAAAPLEAVLRAWQGLGYHRRALALKRAAEEVSARHGGILPCDEGALRALPGVGPATAAGVLAFAHDEPVVYIETNVRAVFIHEFLVDRGADPAADAGPRRIADREIAPLVAASVAEAASAGVGPREWYHALLDYGVHLKRTVANPSRRSAHHVRQSPFEGSRRQKRARLLRAVIATPGETSDDLAVDLGIEPGIALDILETLEAEGFVSRSGAGWEVA